MQSLTGTHQYPCIITFLWLRLSEQRTLSYLLHIFKKLVFLSLHMYVYSKKKCWKKSKNCNIRKKSENVKTPYKNLEKYGSFSEFRTSTEKSVMLATLYQLISNFTNHEPSVMFENCEHCMSRFVKASLNQPLLSSLWMFSYSLWNLRTHKCTVHSSITFTLYTFCDCWCMVNAERFSAVRKCITTCSTYLPDTHLRGSSMFTSQ